MPSQTYLEIMFSQLSGQSLVRSSWHNQLSQPRGRLVLAELWRRRGSCVFFSGWICNGKGCLPRWLWQGSGEWDPKEKVTVSKQGPGLWAQPSFPTRVIISFLGTKAFPLLSLVQVLICPSGLWTPRKQESCLVWPISHGSANSESARH